MHPTPIDMREIATSALIAGIVLLFTVHAGVAQDQEITGTVIDANTEEPLPGVNVRVEGTNIGTTTNVQGEYAVNASLDDVLVFSFVGYNPIEEPVDDRTVIDVTMTEDVEELGEVVVIGYGERARRDVAGSVGSVDVSDAQVGVRTSPEDLIRGRVAGVEMIENTGEPGGGLNVRIRGTSSISASSEPLYVIDGVPINNANTTPGGASAGGITPSASSNPLASLNPGDIESIDILKDAAATAIYGSQGANGVVLVSTKGGEEGTVRVDYTGTLAAAELPNQLPLLSRDEFVDAGGTDLGHDTNWQEAITETAIQQDHSVALSGGTEQTTYRASLGYQDQPGIVLNSGIERLSARINASHRMMEDRLRFDMNLSGTETDRDHTFFGQTSGFEGDIFESMMRLNPTAPVREEDGTFWEPGAEEVRNPVAIQEQVEDFTDNTRLSGNFRAALDILPNLTLDANFGADRSIGTRRSHIPRASRVGAPDGGIVSQNTNELTTLTYQTTLQYQDEIADGQRIDILGGAEYKWEEWQSRSSEVQDFITDALGFDDMGGLSTIDPTVDAQEVTQLSGFTRVNYNILDRYVFEGTARLDGSSVFGEDNLWSFFPSGALSWRMTEEEFLPLDEWFSDFRVRASYGLSGNQAIPPYASLQQLGIAPDFSAVFDGSEATGVAATNLASPDLRWEQTEQVNLAIEFLTGRLDGTLEIYRRDTEDLLLDVSLPQPAVVGSRLENIGSVRNEGIELTLDALVLEQDEYNLSVGGNISTNNNEVLSLGERGEIATAGVSGPGLTGVNSQRIIEGEPLGTFFGPEFAGFNEEGQQIFYVREDGERTDQTTTSPGGGDRTVIGNAVPDFQYGLNIQGQYQNFDLSVFFRGAQGQDIFDNNALQIETPTNLPSQNAFSGADDPNLDTDDSPRYSSRWIKDASFFRLDTFTLGYRVQQLVDTWGLNNLRVHVTAQNLFTITPYEGFDPEVNTGAGEGGFRPLVEAQRGVDYSNYPRPRTFTFGVELGF